MFSKRNRNPKDCPLTIVLDASGNQHRSILNNASVTHFTPEGIELNERRNS
jgi:hypothetical protein